MSRDLGFRLGFRVIHRHHCAWNMKESQSYTIYSEGSWSRVEGCCINFSPWLLIRPSGTAMFFLCTVPELLADAAENVLIWVVL